jgi:hypothetical protein
MKAEILSGKLVDGKAEELDIPGVGRETGFFAGAPEEFRGIPAPFDGHLWQEEAGPPAPTNVESVAADPDLLGPEGNERGEEGQLDGQSGELAGLEGRKAAVADGGGFGHVAHGRPEGLDGFDMADATAELAGDLEGHESGALLSKGAAGIGQIGRGLAARGRFGGPAREVEQGPPVLVGEQGPIMASAGSWG